MQVTWNPEKARANLAKHGIRFSNAETALFDQNAMSRADLTTANEQRFVSLGVDATGRVLVVVYAYRGEDVRLISARSATPNE